MKFKKAVCVYLTFVMFLTGCENLKSRIRGDTNTVASADQLRDKIIESNIRFQPKSKLYSDSFSYVLCSIALVLTLSSFVYATKVSLDKKEFIKYYNNVKEKYELSNMHLNGRKITNVPFPWRHNFLLSDILVYTNKFIMAGVAFLISYLLAT